MNYLPIFVCNISSRKLNYHNYTTFLRNLIVKERLKVKHIFQILITRIAFNWMKKRISIALVEFYV